MCGPMRGQRCVSLVIYTGWPRGEDVRESVTAPVSNINNGHVHKNVKMTLSKRWFSSPMFNAKTIDRICSSVFIWRHRGHWAYHQLTTLMWPKHSHSSHTLPWWTGASQSHFYTILILEWTQWTTVIMLSVHSWVFTVTEGVWVTIWPLSSLLRSRSPGQFVRFNFHNTRDTSLHLWSPPGPVMSPMAELLLVQMTHSGFWLVVSLTIGPHVSCQAARHMW